MFRVLHVMAGADAGGISSVVLNYYLHMDRNKIHFDIALTTNQFGKNGELLQELGANFYYLPLKSKDMHKFAEELSTILKKGKYDCIHVHENETSYVALRIAKKLGIKRRIAHAHSTAPYVSLKGEIRRLSGGLLNYHYATEVIGCGKEAGNRIFGVRHMNSSKAYILPNAIDTKAFLFEENVRVKMRAELGVQNRYVIGMVGRLAKQKNYLYALEIIKKVHKVIPEVMLLVAGNGEDENIIQNYISEHNMEEYVKLLGRRSDVNHLYMSFDAYILTSLFEGFPVAAVEAIASGLPVVLADTITRELEFGTEVTYLPLGNSDLWADHLKELRNKMLDRAKVAAEVINNGLDIKFTARMLENIYLSKENDNAHEIMDAK